MIAPGMTINATNQIVNNASAANTSDFINEGLGFKTGGALCFDTAAPAGDTWDGGIRVNATGCIYSTTTLSGTDVWISGLRMTTLGQLCVESAVGTSFVNGNPLTAAGVLAIV